MVEMMGVSILFVAYLMGMSLMSHFVLRKTKQMWGREDALGMFMTLLMAISFVTFVVCLVVILIELGVMAWGA